MCKSKNLWLSLSLVGFFFCVLGLYLNWFSGLDSLFNNFMTTIQNKWFSFIALVFHYMFEPIYVLGILLIFSIFIWFKGSRNESIRLGLFVAIVALIVALLKNLFHRLRPENMSIAETSFSFPSGHAITAVILFGLIYYYSIFKFRLVRRGFNKYLFYLVFVLSVFLIGFSRVYLNVHWFSDVLAGWSLGGFLLFGFLFFLEGASGKKK